MIFVRNGYISPSRELSPFFRLQYYFKIPINSIVEIKCNGLLERAGKFNKKIKYQYYLDLIMNDNTFERLFMSTFTHKQYLKLKAILLENNPRIVFGSEPERFLDHFTSCV